VGGELRAKLADLQDSARGVEVPSALAVRDAEDAVGDPTLDGTPGQRKPLLKELVVELRVESRESIIPTFRFPAPLVRATETVVRTGVDSNNPKPGPGLMSISVMGGSTQKLSISPPAALENRGDEGPAVPAR